MTSSTHPYLQGGGPIAFAHRGGNREHPENTLAAFTHAVSMGYRYLETDVHLTADGVLVAFHDADLTRTCDVAGEIADLSWSEVSDALVGGSERIPRMNDLFEQFSDIRFNIDCKSDAAMPALIDLIGKRKALDRVCVGSFSYRRLRKLRRALGGRLLTCMSPIEVASLRLTGRVGGNSARVAQVPVEAGRSVGSRRLTVVTERFISNAHRQRIPVHVWTINDEEEIRRLLDLGVDGIMTDDPELLRDILIDRDEWPVS